MWWINCFRSWNYSWPSDYLHACLFAFLTFLKGKMVHDYHSCSSLCSSVGFLMEKLSAARVQVKKEKKINGYTQLIKEHISSISWSVNGGGVMICLHTRRKLYSAVHNTTESPFLQKKNTLLSFRLRPCLIHINPATPPIMEDYTFFSQHVLNMFLHAR